MRLETENKFDVGRVLRNLHRRGDARRGCCDRRPLCEEPFKALPVPSASGSRNARF
jgi:hypothetical protein